MDNNEQQPTTTDTNGVEASGNIILPTHSCFDDALDLLTEFVKEKPDRADSEEFKLVHAICVTPDGQDYSHAWVEMNGKWCMFVGIHNGKRTSFASTVIEYYKEMKVKETTKYSVRQAWNENRKHENYGPWIDRYLKLCKNYQGAA